MAASELSAAGSRLSPACICPITHRIMQEPVSLVDGTICERKALELWFSRGHLVSPLTGVELPSVELTPVPSLQRIISVHLEQLPEFKGDVLDDASLKACIDELEKKPRLEKSQSSLAACVEELETQPWLEMNKVDPNLQLKADRVDELIRWLRLGDRTQQDHALRLLESVVVFNPGQKLVNNESKTAIRRAGGFAVLTNILSNGTPTQKEVVAYILWKCGVEENTVAIRQAGAILPLIRLQDEGTATAKLYATEALKMLDYLRVSADEKHIEQKKDDIANKGIPHLVELLQMAEEESDSADDFEAYVRREGIEGILQHLGDLAHASPENPLEIKRAMGIPPTVHFLRNGTPGQREAAARLILNLCVQQNERALLGEGVQDALRALEYEETGVAGELARSALHVLTKLDADRRCLEAAVIERNRYSVTYSV